MIILFTLTWNENDYYLLNLAEWAFTLLNENDYYFIEYDYSFTIIKWEWLLFTLSLAFTLLNENDYYFSKPY